MSEMPSTGLPMSLLKLVSGSATNNLSQSLSGQFVLLSNLHTA